MVLEGSYKNVFATDFKSMTKKEIQDFWDSIPWKDYWLDQLKDFHRGKKTKIRFLKYLTTEKACFSNIRIVGGQISSISASRNLGLTPTAIQDYLRDLQVRGWVELCDPNYVDGLYARRFRVVHPTLRRIQLKVYKGYLSPTIMVSARKGIKELELEMLKKKMWLNLTSHKITTKIDKEGEVTFSVGTEALKKAIQQLVKLYNGKEFSLITDFAVHMYHKRNVYSTDRKMYMAWYFDDCIKYYKTTNSILTKNHYYDAAFIRDTDLFEFKTALVPYLTKKTLTTLQFGMPINLLEINTCRKTDRANLEDFSQFEEWTQERVMSIESFEFTSKDETQVEWLENQKNIVNFLLHDSSTGHSQSFVEV